MSARPVLYGLSSCDSCRRARRALDAAGLDYVFHDLRGDGIDRTRVDAWIEQVGLERLINRRSRTWRELEPGSRESLDDEGVRELLVSHPALIRRPLLATADGRIEIGREVLAHGPQGG